MSYFEFTPSSYLKPFVDCYWLHSLDSSVINYREQSCLPLGTVELIVQVNHRPSHHLNHNGVWEKSQRVFFAGLYEHPVVWKAGAESIMFGIRLKSESLIQLFRFPVASLINLVGDAQALLGHWIYAMGEEMCGLTDAAELVTIAEKYLYSRLKETQAVENRFVAACRLLRNNPENMGIDELSGHLNISRRQLERIFKNQMGTSAKTYQRIVRFTHTYHQILNGRDFTWVDLTYNNGYSDQSHFIRDFKEFAGDVPTEFKAKSQSFMPKTLSIHSVEFMEPFA